MDQSQVIQIITTVAQQNSIPAYIPLTIAQHESSFNPSAVGDSGTSFGLFQLHVGGLAPSNMTDAQLFDPLTNAQIAIPNMLNAYHRGVSQGLDGFDLTAYVANNSGWPANLGVDWTNANTSYNAGLRVAYGIVGGNSAGAVAVDSPGSGLVNLTATQIRKKMEANSAAWYNADPATQAKLHDENVALGALLGGSYDQASGNWSSLDLSKVKDMSQGDLQTYAAVGLLVLAGVALLKA